MVTYKKRKVSKISISNKRITITRESKPKSDKGIKFTKLKKILWPVFASLTFILITAIILAVTKATTNQWLATILPVIAVGIILELVIIFGPKLIKPKEAEIKTKILEEEE